MDGHLSDLNTALYFNKLTTNKLSRGLPGRDCGVSKYCIIMAYLLPSNGVKWNAGVKWNENACSL